MFIVGTIGLNVYCGYDSMKPQKELVSVPMVLSSPGVYCGDDCIECLLCLLQSITHGFNSCSNVNNGSLFSWMLTENYDQPDWVSTCLALKKLKH